MITVQHSTPLLASHALFMLSSCATGDLCERAAVDGGRVNIAACSVGGGQACLDAARAYAAQRSQFGRPIAAFQVQLDRPGGSVASCSQHTAAAARCISACEADMLRMAASDAVG